MERLVLYRPVTLIGPSFLGFNTSTIISRHPNRQPGWWLNCGSANEKDNPDKLILLNYENLVLGKNSLDLVARPRPPIFVYIHGLGTIHLGRRFGFRARIIEHLLALRFAGLDEVVLSFPEGRVRYDTSGATFWETALPHLTSAGRLSRYRLPSHFVGDERRWMSCHSEECGPGLTIHVHIDYGNGLMHNETYTWSLATFERVVQARTLGFPRWRKPVARLAHLCGWPHYPEILWPRDRPSPRECQETADHHVLDLLGEMALAQPAGGLLDGVYERHCGGHKLGLELCRRVGDTWHAYNRPLSRVA